MKKLISLLSVMILLCCLVIPPNDVGASGGTRYTLSQISKQRVLKNGSLVVLEVGYEENTQNLYEFEVNILYEASKFEVVSYESKIESLRIHQVREEIDTTRGNCYVQFRGLSLDGITNGSGPLFEITLESTGRASNTSVSLMVASSVVHNPVTHKAVYGEQSLGKFTVTFSATYIPWWVYLIVALVIVLALVGGYIFHLLAPNAIPDTINKIFPKKIIAPKMKPSSNAIKVEESSTHKKP